MTGLDAVEQFVVGAGLVILVLGVVKLVFVPLAIAFDLMPNRRRTHTHGCTHDADSLVSVVVPAYNESTVIENCLRSVLRSNHRHLELVVVDDGSTDDTLAKAHACAGEDDRVRVLSVPNGGKGAALNRGIEASTGEIVLLVDSDGVFDPEMVDHMLAAFDRPDVGAVCGDDRPVNLDRVQTRFLSLISHVGTGLVRRALSLMGCLPIVSGNVGAFRRSALHRVGPLDEETVGEDLELTWRIHRAGYRVCFQPRALVYAESPSTLKALWRQRVRWNRGLLQVTDMHADVVGNPRFGTFGLYLLFNLLTMVVVPLLQLLLMPLLAVLLVNGRNPIGTEVWSLLLWFGLVVSTFLVLVSVALNRAWGDFRYAAALLLWPLFSVFTGLTLLAAMVGEARADGHRGTSWSAPGWSPANSSSSRRTRDAPVRGVALVATVALGPLLLVGCATTSPPPADRSVNIGYETVVQDDRALDDLTEALDRSGATRIGISAGRPEWAAFPWAGHEEHVATPAVDVDLVGRAIDHLGGARSVTIMVDMLAPTTAQTYPHLAGRDALGRPSTEFLSVAEITEGEYAQRSVDFVAAIAGRYRPDAISITELLFDDFTFGETDLSAYSRWGGNDDWPRGADGAILVDDPSIGAWRSAAIAGLAERMAAAAHAHDVELVMDVRANFADPMAGRPESGHDYALLLEHVDALEVWAYVGLATHGGGAVPDLSRLTRDLVAGLGRDRVTISVGLWDNDGGAIPAAELQQSLGEVQRGGAASVSVTPASLMTRNHWDAFFEAWGAASLTGTR